MTRRKYDLTWTRIDAPTPAPPPVGGAGAPPDSPPAAKAAQGGLECPKCGCRHFEVIETTQRRPGAILRRRACRHCGHRVTTYERVIHPK